jgi:hypothetical protein
MSTTTTHASSGAGEVPPEMIRAAAAEYERWGTGVDTSRPKGERDWVCRRDDTGVWQVVSYHTFGEADHERHARALAAAIRAALTTGAAR